MLYSSQINLLRRPCNIQAPMMLIDRIFLIQIQLEKAVVIRTFEVLVRVDLGEVGGDEGFFGELDVWFAFRCRCGDIGG